MSNTNDGGPAFPCTTMEPTHGIEFRNGEEVEVFSSQPVDHPGLSLRDHFAGKALQGMCSNYKLLDLVELAHLSSGEPVRFMLAHKSYEIADAMLAARGTPDPARAKLVEALKNAKLQIEYLHEKFKQTGSGNHVLAQIDAALALAGGGA